MENRKGWRKEYHKKMWVKAIFPAEKNILTYALFILTRAWLHGVRRKQLISRKSPREQRRRRKKRKG